MPPLRLRRRERQEQRRATRGRGRRSSGRAPGVASRPARPRGLRPRACRARSSPPTPVRRPRAGAAAARAARRPRPRPRTPPHPPPPLPARCPSRCSHTSPARSPIALRARWSRRHVEARLSSPPRSCRRAERRTGRSGARTAFPPRPPHAAAVPPWRDVRGPDRSCVWSFEFAKTHPNIFGLDIGLRELDGTELPDPRPQRPARVRAVPGHDDVRVGLGLGRRPRREPADLRRLRGGGRQLRRHRQQLHERDERAIRRRVRRRRPRPLRARHEVHALARPRRPERGRQPPQEPRRSLEQSLRRLRTDYVDLLWLHMRDSTTPIDEAVRALDDQVRLGKVLAVGISDSPAWVVAQANAIADLRGWSPFTALQIPYNVASREPERELLPMAEALGLAVTPWGVLEAGILTGKPDLGAALARGEVSDTAARVLAVLREIAEAREATPAQVAIAWLLRRPDAADDRPDRRRAPQRADRREPRRARRRAGRRRGRPPGRRGQAAARLPAELPRVERRPRAHLRQHVREAEGVDASAFRDVSGVRPRTRPKLDVG